MPYAKSGNCNIYYETHGDGVPLVFVHGAGGNHAIWWQQVSHFRASYRVITIDLRGFGRSDSVSDGPDALDFPADISAVLQAAKAERSILLGQSIGAVAALRCAISPNSDVAAVVLANSVGGLDHPDLGPLVRSDRARAEQLPVIDRLLTKLFQMDHSDLTFLFQQIGTFNHARMPDLRNSKIPGPTPAQLEASGVRVLFLAGEKDAVLSPETARAAQRLIRGSRIEVVQGAPHSMYWESPESFNAVLERCLNELQGVT